jgi:hypothetical protein
MTGAHSRKGVCEHTHGNWKDERRTNALQGAMFRSIAIRGNARFMAK